MNNLQVIQTGSMMLFLLVFGFFCLHMYFAHGSRMHLAAFVLAVASIADVTWKLLT